MRGFSRSNLEYMRRFAAAYPGDAVPQQAVGELPWGHVTVLLDEAAAGRLQLAGYYRETYAAKPAWQGL